MDTKEFKVAAIANNQNKFGVYGMILLAADGEAWHVGASDISGIKMGAVVHVPVTGEAGRKFGLLGFEIWEPLQMAPIGAVADFWN